MGSRAGGVGGSIGRVGEQRAGRWSGGDAEGRGVKASEGDGWRAAGEGQRRGDGGRKGGEGQRTR